VPATTFDQLELTDLSDPVMFTNPYPRYAELRRNAPVSRVRSKQMLRGDGFMLTKYEDVVMMHTDQRFSSATVTATTGPVSKALPQVLRLLGDSMVFKDDPDHKRLRSLVSRAFTPRMVAGLAEDVDSIVAGLVKDVAGRGTVDLVHEYALPLPLNVIADMLGVGEADRANFHHWSSSFTEGATSGLVGMLKALPTGRRMTKLFAKLAQDARTTPGHQLISVLVQANDEGDRLGEEELLAMIFLLLLAGHDTTQNLIGSATLALIENPDQLAALRAHPELIGTALDELLRYTTPVPCGAARVLTEDVELRGVVMPRGSKVLGMIISANRDEEVFANPEVLDLARAPNEHVTFARGMHFCLGHQLARLEGSAALSALIQSFDKIELAVPRHTLSYKSTQSLRGLNTLPLRLA
jgi:cytochrome P450 PksS